MPRASCANCQQAWFYFFQAPDGLLSLSGAIYLLCLLQFFNRSFVIYFAEGDKEMLPLSEATEFLRRFVHHSFSIHHIRFPLSSIPLTFNIVALAKFWHYSSFFNVSQIFQHTTSNRRNEGTKLRHDRCIWKVQAVLWERFGASDSSSIRVWEFINEEEDEGDARIGTQIPFGIN